MARFFVGGYLRTGTTLLQSILCNSPDCNPMIGEAVFLRGIVEAYRRSLQMFDLHAKYYFDDEEQLRRLCAGYTEDFLAATEKRFSGPKHLVLKHPQLTPHFPWLHRLTPDSRFIVIVRDPRDTVASAVSAMKKGAAEFGTLDIAGLATDMLLHYTACFGCRLESFHRQTLYVTYEGLVQDPGPVVSALQEFTGIDLSGFTPDMGGTRSEVDFDSADEKERALHSEHYGQAVSDARVGRFADVLSDDDVRTVERICKPVVNVYREGASVFSTEFRNNRCTVKPFRLS